MSFKIASAEDYGRVLQLKSIDEKNIPQEVTISVNFEKISGEFPDGEKYTLLKPTYKFENWNYGNPSNFQFSPRVAPVVYGLGLLSLIPEEDLKKKEDINDSDNDGISGKLNLVENRVTRQKEIGRFGWKAGQPNLKQFIATALLEDIGITSEIFLEQNCTKVQTSCKQKQSHGMEIDLNSLDDLEFYIKYLAVPARRNLENQDVKIGKNLFISIGCESCHISEWKTGKHSENPELSEQTIYPYTDLMLHDMGDGLADGFEEFLANGKEWRTPPLWGIGLYSQISQHNFLLHDGRARGLQEAIL
ncbi:MAG: di-heme oxidoredictase family protein, partial [Candidatus Pacearchaeota archaeon]